MPLMIVATLVFTVSITHAADSSIISTGLIPSEISTQSTDTNLWPTQADFLTATRNGDLVGVPNIAGSGDYTTGGAYYDTEFEKVLHSVTQILQNEYGVPPIYSYVDRQIKQEFRKECKSRYGRNVAAFMREVTMMHTSTLSDQPPSFYKDANAWRVDMVRQYVDLMGRPDGPCYLEVIGQRKPLPYESALIKFMSEYGQATKEYVETERNRKKIAYVHEQARIEADRQANIAAQAKREADERAEQVRQEAAAAQKHTDVEQARSEAEQEKIQAVIAKRVGGKPRPMFEDVEKKKQDVGSIESISPEVFRDSFNKIISSKSYSAIIAEKIYSYGIFSNHNENNTTILLYTFASGTQMIINVDKNNNKIRRIVVLSTINKNEKSKKSLMIMLASSTVLQPSSGNNDLSGINKVIIKMISDSLSNRDISIEKKVGRFKYTTVLDNSLGRLIFSIVLKP